MLLMFSPEIQYINGLHLLRTSSAICYCAITSHYVDRVRSHLKSSFQIIFTHNKLEYMDKHFTMLLLFTTDYRGMAA